MGNRRCNFANITDGVTTITQGLLRKTLLGTNNVTTYTWIPSGNIVSYPDNSKDEKIKNDTHPIATIWANNAASNTTATITVSASQGTIPNNCTDDISFPIQVKGTQPSIKIVEDVTVNKNSIGNVNLVKGCSFAAAIVPRLNPGSNPAYQFRSPEYSWSPVYGVDDNDAIDSNPAKFILSPDVSTIYDVYVNHDFTDNPNGCCTNRPFKINVYDFVIKTNNVNTNQYGFTKYNLEAVFNTPGIETQCPSGVNGNCNTYRWYKCNMNAFNPNDDSNWSPLGYSSNNANEIEVSTNYDWYLICRVNVDNDMNPSPPNLPLFGCTDIMAYTQITHNPAATQNRLIEVVISLRKEDSAKNASQSLIVYPNPTSGEINLALQASSDSKAMLSLFDLSGKALYSKSVTLNTENTLVKLPSSISPGIYFLSVKTGSTASASFIKIIIQKP